MSSPQRQVGSRRLPPLPKAVPSGFVKVGKNETSIAKTTFSSPGLNSKLSLELSNDLMEGPFRPALTPETFAQFLSSAKAQNDGAQQAGKDGLIPEFLDPNVVELYLKYNPQFLDEFINANIQRVQIAKWLDMKSRSEENHGLMSGPQMHGMMPSSKWKDNVSGDNAPMDYMFNLPKE